MGYKGKRNFQCTGRAFLLIQSRTCFGYVMICRNGSGFILWYQINLILLSATNVRRRLADTERRKMENFSADIGAIASLWLKKMRICSMTTWSLTVMCRHLMAHQNSHIEGFIMFRYVILCLWKHLWNQTKSCCSDYIMIHINYCM